MFQLAADYELAFPQLGGLVMWAALFSTVFVISFSLLFATIAMDREG
jgi:hypothetical protein